MTDKEVFRGFWQVKEKYFGSILRIPYEFEARMIRVSGGHWRRVRWRWHLWTRLIRWTDMGARRAPWEWEAPL